MPFKCENCWTPEGLHISYSGSYKSMMGMLSNPNCLGTRTRCQMSQMSRSLLRLCFLCWQIEFPLKAKNEAYTGREKKSIYEKQNCIMLCQVLVSFLPVTAKSVGNSIHYWIWILKNEDTIIVVTVSFKLFSQWENLQLVTTIMLKKEQNHTSGVCKSLHTMTETLWVFHCWLFLDTCVVNVRWC